MGDRKKWRCFHCDEVFTSRFKAQEHFGLDEYSTPACRISGAATGLITALREAEEAAADAIFKLHNESSEAAKAYWTMTARHSQALVRADELGYERGLRDGRAA